MTVSTDSTVAGEAATMTISFTTSQPFLANSWIYLTVPKANKSYDTGNNSGAAISLVTDLNSSTGTFSIGGTELTIDTSSVYYV